MDKIQNIGSWTAQVHNDGKAPQIVVKGRFPTFGHKPGYHLIKNEPQGINATELLLTLVFGTLVDPNGTVFFGASYTELIESVATYETVHIVDADNRTLAKITLFQKFKSRKEEEELDPYLEVLKGFEISEGTLKLRVPSKGMTSKESLQIEIIKGFTSVPPHVISVYRLAPDYGKAFLPDGIVLEYTPSELQLDRFESYRLENIIG